MLTRQVANTRVIHVRVRKSKIHFHVPAFFIFENGNHSGKIHMSTLIVCLHHAVFQISRSQLVKKAEVYICVYLQLCTVKKIIKILPTFLVISTKQFHRSEYAGTLTNFGSDIFFISFIQYFYHIMMMNQHFTLFTC